MSNKFLWLVLLLPLLFSCQKYNKPPFDEIEEKLRKYPDSLKMLVLDSFWQKRDSLSYLRFKNLEQIYLVETDSIPKWIIRFSKLKTVNSANQNIKIDNLPRDLGVLKNMEQFYFPNNNISDFPYSFFNLFNLKRLNIENNKFLKIEGSIGNLKNLEALAIDNNKIEYLPDNICSLKKMKLMSIENTLISSLPLCLVNLRELEDVYISNTHISHIPIQILSLPNLKNIRAKGLKLDNYKEVKEICKKRNIAFYYDE